MGLEESIASVEFHENAPYREQITREGPAETYKYIYGSDADTFAV